MLHVQVIRQGITQILFTGGPSYLVTGEKNPGLAWNLNMQGLLNVLDIAMGRKADEIILALPLQCSGPLHRNRIAGSKRIIEPTTVYGISKYAGEFWCNYFHNRFGVDVRSLRYPGLISYKSPPRRWYYWLCSGDISRSIGRKEIPVLSFWEHFPANDVYIPDAIRAMIELMEAPAAKISVRTSTIFRVWVFHHRRLQKRSGNTYRVLQWATSPITDSRLPTAGRKVLTTVARMDWGWKEEYNLRRWWRGYADQPR